MKKMKQYIKDGKIYNLPVEVKIGDEVTYTNNEMFLKEHGYEEYIQKHYKPTMEEEIEQSIETINKETDERILNDFVWRDNEFYLSLENQFNFKNLFDLREIKEYPITIKTKTGFTTLNDVHDVEEFYLAGFKFIEECLKEGWEKKAASEEKIRSEYK